MLSDDMLSSSYADEEALALDFFFFEADLAFCFFCSLGLTRLTGLRTTSSASNSAFEASNFLDVPDFDLALLACFPPWLGPCFDSRDDWRPLAGVASSFCAMRDLLIFLVNHLIFKF